ncbi:MAG: ABC transporter permease, partial [Chloroflexi bacterium]|nr:ABC transporter permease [Chloroflexota bacterium]
SLVICFVVYRVMPGNVAEMYVTTIMTPEEQASILKRFGLDQPLWTQFLLFMKNSLTGNFGISFAKNIPISALLSKAIPRSVGLLLPSMLISITIGYFLGSAAGWRAGSKRDSAIMGFATFIQSAPIFWVGMVLLFVFSYILGWFPVGGFQTIGAIYPSIWDKIGDYTWHAVLPVATLVIHDVGRGMLMMRNMITLTLKENYITTAQAKGISDSRVQHRHAARNASIPLVTHFIVGITHTIGGSVLIEKIFSYPGVGLLMFDGVLAKDFPMIQATFIIFNIMGLCTIIFLDIIYTYIDPRVKY